jgi:3D (Asp-Asp-Asp) domain-containing protein
MKRILAGLAALALSAAASAVNAQAAQTDDPIGDLIAKATQQPGDAGSGGWSLRATLYHGGGRMSSRDSLGCRVSPMRTVAIDSRLIARGAILFIKETVGMILPGGGRHDGYWYASDTGSAIKGQRIDLFTGPDGASMNPALPLNLKSLTVQQVGQFKGCPPVDSAASLAHVAKLGEGDGVGGPAAGVAKSARPERPAALRLASDNGTASLEDWLNPKRPPDKTGSALRGPGLIE